MAQAFIGLGSNLGERRSHLRAAVAALKESGHVTLCRVSRFVETLPQGGPPQPRFLNGAAEIQTELSPGRLLELLLRIEANLGRVRGEKWEPRTIDLDLLLYDREVIRGPDLVVPHPRMHERVFVLQPLVEIAPDAWHPVLGKTVEQLLDELREQDCRILIED